MGLHQHICAYLPSSLRLLAKKSHRQYLYRSVTTGTSRRHDSQEVRDCRSNTYLSYLILSRFTRSYGYRFHCPYLDKYSRPVHFDLASQLERRRNRGGDRRWRHRCSLDRRGRVVVRHPSSPYSLCSIYGFPRRRERTATAPPTKTLRQCLFFILYFFFPNNYKTRVTADLVVCNPQDPSDPTTFPSKEYLPVSNQPLGSTSHRRPNDSGYGGLPEI